MRKRLYRAGLVWLMAVGVALLLRWLYVVWPNTLTAVLTPVSASPWCLFAKIRYRAGKWKK